MSEENDVEEFQGIERTPRYESRNILGREIYFRVKYTPEEQGYLSRFIGKWIAAAEKIDNNATDQQILNYANACAEITPSLRERLVMPSFFAKH